MLRRNYLAEVVVVNTENENSPYATTTMQTYSQPFSSGGSDQFPGQKEDAETGWKDFGARPYNPLKLRGTVAPQQE